jgi:hypothetical protein
MMRVVLIALLLLALGLPTIAACAPASAPVATSASAAVWGEIPRDCACRDTESMARVSADLQQAALPVDVRLESMRDGWQIFSVRFDPARVSADRVRQVLESAGAHLIAAPVGQ